MLFGNLPASPKFLLAVGVAPLPHCTASKNFANARTLYAMAEPGKTEISRLFIDIQVKEMLKLPSYPLNMHLCLSKELVLVI